LHATPSGTNGVMNKGEKAKVCRRGEWFKSKPTNTLFTTLD
jgi:hypothetical protein